MAVAFDAVGPAGGAGAKSTATPLTWAHINSAAGNAILVGVNYRTGTSSDVTTVTYGGVTLSRLGQVPANNAGPGGIDLWGKIGALPTGSNTVSVTFGTATADLVTGGSISLTGAVSFGTAVTGFAAAGSISVNVTGTTSGNMIAAVASYGNSLVFSTTSPGTQRWAVNGDSNEAADNTVGGTWASPGGTQAVGFSNSNTTDWWGLVAVEVKGAAVAPTSPVALLPLLAPGWFPGSAAVTQDPGGTPFYAEPQPTDQAPAVIIPPTPEAAGLADYQPLPPGWFPGADTVTAMPGGMPFTPVPPPQTVTPAVIFPVPETAGIVDYLPLPPGYFPGSQAVAVDPGGIPYYSQPQPLTPPPAPQAPAVISDLGGGSTGYFIDQYGSPRLVVGDAAWGLPANAGRWNSGDWHGTYDAYLTSRAAQGFTVIYTDAFGSTHNGGVFDDGRTWDGVTPFVSGGDPSTGLNNTFWARIDYLLAKAATLGITVFLNLGASWDMETAGYALTGKTTQQFQDYGTAMATRYRNTANLIWMVADDYFGNEDTQITAMLASMRAAGDTTPIAIENFAETTSRKVLDTGGALAWGVSHAQFSFVYSYNVTYFGVETAWAESSSVPVIWGDGTFYSHSFNEHLMRNLAWWALSSGARGMINGDEAIWQWPTTAAADTTTGSYYTTQVGIIRAAFESLTGWHLLIPDTASTFVTAGRGTRATSLASGGGGGAYSGTTDAYVTASKTPDGSLAVVYMSHGSTITIDQSKLGAGYTATWIDPVSGATSAAATGPTYNSTAKGNNSAGDPDWVLAFQGPPVSSPVPASGTGLADYLPLPPGWFPGSDKVTNLPGGIPFQVIPQPADQVAAPAAVITIATAALAAAGAVAAVVTEAPIATAAGAGSVAAVVTEAAGAAAAGAGTVTAVVTEIAGASLAGGGAVSDVATQAVTAALAGAGSVTDVVTEIVTASLAGAGAVNATVAGGASTATITGAGAVTAAATQAVTATAAGAGAVTAAVTQAASAALTGAGSLTAAGAITGTASLAGSGALTAKTVQAAIAAPAGAGALAALAAQRAVATLAGAGAMTATATSTASIVNATSSPAVTAGRTSAASITGRAAATAVSTKASSSPAVSDG